MSHNFQIQEGAYIISDAHYSHKREELLLFLKSLFSKALIPPQIIFMGDIFDALFGGIPYTYIQNKVLIDLINDMSQKIEILYLEGNHDFNLQKLFPLLRVIPLSQQPLLCTYKNKKIYLAHGDFDGARGYKIYTAVIRNAFVLFLLKHVDNISNHYILKKLDMYLSKKEDCIDLHWFKDFIYKRMEDRFECEYFIEGHFHQNRHFHLKNFKYVNLAAFACNQRYFIVKSFQDKEILEENSFS